MRTSAKFLIGSLALGVFASQASASGPNWVHGSWTSPLALVQTPSGGSFQTGVSREKVEAENWLRKFRLAMAEGNFELAEYAIRKAEEHASRMSEQDGALEFTPQQARAEFARRHQAPAPAGFNGQQGQVAQGLYNPSQDNTRNIPAGNQQGSPLGQGGNNLPAPGAGQLDAQQDLLRQKLTQEIFREREIAERMVENKNPRGALAHLQSFRARLDQAQIDPASRRQFLALVDREIAELENYIQRNMADIRNDEINAERMAQIQMDAQNRLDIDQQMATLVEDFNELMDEARWAEAEAVARQAHELAPNMPVVQNMIWKSKYARNIAEQYAIRDAKERGVIGALAAVDEAGIPFDDRESMMFPGVDEWNQISRRAGMTREQQLSQEEIRILETLKTERIEFRFDNTPLEEALNIIGAQAGLNFYLDRQAMAAEAVMSDTPVTIDLRDPIVLESGLKLLLENLSLTFEVRDDVVRVTTPGMKSKKGFERVYYVGDLVMPIPNFVPTYNMGLAGALANAYQNLGYGPGGNSPSGNLGGGFGLASNNNSSSIANAMAQNLPGGALNGSSSSGGSLFGQGANGMGGGIQADFDPLMELIQRTIEPDTWEDLGGTGRMEEFRQNLSLVIYQSQEVHEQIQDLLDQLRRLQDLQITIEVRFITLQDDFFERIGVDFDFDVRNTTGPSTPTGANFDPNSANGVFGLNASPSQATPPIFTPDLDLQFTQGNFGSAIPAFGGFDAGTAANFGFAILSDIEVYMLLQAAKGDTRTNILQAPKVTLFNGQTALVNDTSQRPFVTGIVPVVGDFAAAQMPVVIVLNEGTQLSVNAVASDDRRFIRLTLVPFFSEIGAVEEFTFEGSETTNSGTANVDPTNPDSTVQDGATTVRTGTTVQLPVFASTSVNTTVSVPDGGTVLLGGIKRLSEGRNERGVPMLSNLPFINRLFKNVGIGRTSQSLMMMVTPRIIIQEEEEGNQLGLSGN